MLLAGREDKEGEVKEHIWGEVDGRSNGKGESALEKMLIVVEYGSSYFRRHEGAGRWVFGRGEKDKHGGSA